MANLSNHGVADALQEIAQLLELKGEGLFRIRAYENAARAIRNLSADATAVDREGTLTSVPGVGDAIAKKIHELLETGQMKYLQDLRAEFPAGVRHLMLVPGVGPKMAARVYHELGIESLEELEVAASDGRLAALPRLGEKTSENLIRAISRTRTLDTARTPIGQVRPYVQMLLERLGGQAFVSNLTIAGSLRRFTETVRDVDMIATSETPSESFDYFLSLPGIREVIARGPTKLSVISDRNLNIDFRVVPHECYGSLLQHFTGSKAHNVELRELAGRRGLSLSEYGITDVETGIRTAFAEESQFYAALGLPWIPPELREGLGEIEAARRGSLPRLVDLDDIRGDLHCHTDWSDGKDSLASMVDGAIKRGYEYVAITDHSPARPGGLSVDRLRLQAEAIRDIQATRPEIRILHGTEVDIKTDGQLDFPDEILESLDWVVASVHSNFSIDRHRMTDRLVAAIENPHVDAIGHPTGRILGGRPPYDVNFDAILSAAAMTGTAIEINASPKRLDINDVHVRSAIRAGVNLTINTDAHATRELTQMDYGIGVARRGWAEAGSIVNTRTVVELLFPLSNGSEDS